MLLFYIICLLTTANIQARQIEVIHDTDVENQKSVIQINKKENPESIQAKSDKVGTNVKKNKTIIVGDSRTFNMSKWAKTDNNTEFVAKSCQGYTWFFDKGIGQVNNIANNGDTIIIWLGVNDYRAKKYKGKTWLNYANLINELYETDWKNYNIYVASVGYVDRNKIIKFYKKDNRSNISSIGTDNIKGIKAFNSNLKNNLASGIQWIDLSEVIGIPSSDKKTKKSLWLVKKDGKTDGLHYSKEMTQKIYDYFIEYVQE